MITAKSVPDLLRVPVPAVPNGQQPVRILICGVLPGVNNIVQYCAILCISFMSGALLKRANGRRRCHRRWRAK